MEAHKSRPWQWFTMKRYRLLWLVVVAACLVPLLWACAYVRPSDDDFIFTANTYAALVQGGGVWGVVTAAFQWMVYYFEAWQGTFFSVFLTALFPVGAAGGKYVGLMSAAVLLLLAASMVSLCRAVCRTCGVSRPVADCGALIMLFTAFAWLPSFCEGVYWFTGITVYLLPFSVSLFCASSILRYGLRYQNGGWTVGRGLWLAALGVLCFLSGGQSYIASFLCVLALGIYAIVQMIRKAPTRYEVLALWLLVLAGFACCALAPGNLVRQAEIDGGGAAKRSAVTAILLSIQYTFSFLADHIHLQWIALAVLFLPVALCFVRQTRFRFPMPFWVVVGSFGLLAAGFCPGYYVYGNRPGPLRLLNVQYLMLIFLFFANQVYITGWFVRRYVEPKAIGQSPVSPGDGKRLLAVLLCGAVLFTGVALRDTRLKPFSLRVDLAFMKVARELANGSLATYAQEYDRIIEDVVSSDEKVIQVERFSFLPATFYTLRLGEDDYLPSNERLPTYYGKPDAWVEWLPEEDEASVS